MKRLSLSLSLAAITTVSPAAWFTNSVSVDSFVRAATPALNYGGAGGLSISGQTATNGLGVANGAFDTFIRFNTAALVTNADSLFGPNNWVVNGARLYVTEITTPTSPIFNRGTGKFEIRWIANDSWTEGTGTPIAPADTGIVFNDEPSLLNAATDVSLGTFTNAGVVGGISFPLALPPAFVSDITAGGEIGLFLTAIDSGIGFNFHSRSYLSGPDRPALEISVVSQPRPVITGIAIMNKDVLITATNGVAGNTYYVLSTTNLTQPANAWSRIATNQLSVGGQFTTTVTNGASTAAAQCFRLQMR